MSVTVTLSTTLRACVPDYSPAHGVVFELEGASGARDLAVKLRLPLDEIKIVMVNGRRVSLEQIVQDGDRVAFFPAVGGG